MGINIEKYHRWKGAHTAKWQRIATITKKGARSAFKSKWIIALLVLAYFTGVVARIFGMVFFSFKFEASFFQELYGDMELWIILLAAVAGSGLIADDFKDKSLVLYFSRISKKGYLLGKFGVLSSVLSSVVFLPGLLLFLIALISSSESWSKLLDHFWILGAIVAMSFLIIVLLSSVAMALSSMTVDKRYAGAGIFIIFIFSDIIARILDGLVKNDLVHLISFWDNIDVVGRQIFDIGNKYSFSWYNSLVILLLVILLSIGILYWNLFRKELRV